MNDTQFLPTSVTDQTRQAALPDTVTRLREERDRLRSTLDHLPAISFSVDKFGRFLVHNQQLCQLAGYSDDDIRHMTLFDFFAGRGRDDLQAAMVNAFETGEGFDLDLPLIDHGGEQIPISLYAAMSRQGEDLVLTGIALDVTHIRDTLRASAISEERLHRSQAFANIGLWDWNLRTDEVYWSDRVSELIGSTNSRMQFGFQEFLAAAHPLDRARLANSIENCVSGTDILDEEYRVQRPNGSERWMLARANLICDDQGTPARMLGVIQDITPMKHAEFIEKRAREQIQSIIDSLEARICVVDERGEIVSVNRSWRHRPYRHPEHSHSLASGGNYLAFCDDLAATGRADMARLGDAVRSVLAARVKFAESEIAVRMGAREEIHLVRVTPLRGSTEAHPSAVIHHLDVTKRRQIEQDLRLAKDEAEQASRAKSEFLSLMSHELRTPMNAVLGFAQLLEQDDALNADQHENVGEILKAGRHLLHLINEVLDLARVESGRVELSFEPVDLGDLVAECLPLIETQARSDDIRLECGSLQEIRVHADRVRLKQVLINLLSNAVKYNSPHGLVRVEATLSEEGRVCIAVTDTGLGIDQSEIAGLFSPFSRLERDTHREGTGIGLALCRRLIEAMGGRIGATSQLGQGSRFWLELDVAQATPGADSNRDSPSVPGEAPPDLPASVRCLLQIEDNPSNLKLMDRMLARYPRLRTMSASSGEEGMERARTERPDLILLDIHMPGMDGYAVLAALRADRGTAEIPVIALTANATKDDIQRGLAAGFDAYLTKPVQLRDLTRTLSEVMAARESAGGAVEELV